MSFFSNSEPPMLLTFSNFISLISFYFVYSTFKNKYHFIPRSTTHPEEIKLLRRAKQENQEAIHKNAGVQL